MLTTSRLRVEVSKFVKQEIHSLINYMHSNLTHQQVTTTLSRHFAKVGPSPCKGVIHPLLLLGHLPWGELIISSKMQFARREIDGRKFAVPMNDMQHIKGLQTQAWRTCRQYRPFSYCNRA